MKKIIVRGALALVALLLVGALYIGSVVWRVRSAKPNWSGELSLAVLDQPVRVLRNTYGVPHIFAETEQDMYRAQGFVHAQDHFGKMALQRQVTRGRLAEWLGTLGVGADRRMRTLDILSGAKDAWGELPEDVRAFAQAYSDGVNAWLTSEYYQPPPELIALHVSPEPWEPLDSLLVLRLLHLGFVLDGYELLEAQLSQSGASPDIARIFRANDRPVPPIIDEPAGGTVVQGSEALKEGSFSDSWILSGAHTHSGKPLLANDPHQGSVMPLLFQIQRLVGGDVEVAGASIPGLPGVIIGHNGSVAWGVTSGHIDAIDYALLEVDPHDTTRFRRGPSSPWETFETRSETLEVRFGSPIELEVRSTGTGVVWPNELLSSSFEGGPNVVLERRQASLEAPDTSMLTFHDLLRARNVSQAVDALAHLTGPQMNITLADTAGSIAYVAAGRLWKRPETRATMIGFAPDDGNEGELLSFEENPQVVDPPSGRIVSANHRIIGDAYPHYLSRVWASPDRALRIHELLDGREQHDPESFLEMQVDVLSPVARRLVPMLLKRTRSGANDDLLETLRAWDYRFAADATAPTVFMTWLAEINERILLDEVDTKTLPGPYNQMDYRTAAMVLSDGPESWCDDQSTAPVEDCPATLDAALTAARDRMTERFGDDPSGWRWERASEVVFKHPMGSLPLVGSTFNARERVSGGPDALFNFYPDLSLAPTFEFAWTTPHYQAIYDLADLDASLFMGAGGSTGYPGSEYYRILFEPWRRGERMQLPRNPEHVDAGHELTLKP